MSAVGLPLAASLLSAGGQIYQGVEENNAQKRAARADVENARLSYSSGEQQAMDILREARFEQGRAAATIGQGLAFGGSVGTVLADSARAAEIDIERVRAEARGQAANYYASARERRKAGRSALVGGIFNAVSTAVGGVAADRQSTALAQQRARQAKVEFSGAGGGARYSYAPVKPGGRKIPGVKY